MRDASDGSVKTECWAGPPALVVGICSLCFIPISSGISKGKKKKNIYYAVRLFGCAFITIFKNIVLELARMVQVNGHIWMDELKSLSMREKEEEDETKGEKLNSPAQKATGWRNHGCPEEINSPGILLSLSAPSKGDCCSTVRTPILTQTYPSKGAGGLCPNTVIPSVMDFQYHHPKTA